MSIVPYREARRAKRPALDREQIVRAALELLDEVGLDELTMRRVAERLDVKAASLYRHVKDKEELLIHLADAISGEISVDAPGNTWQARLASMAREVRRVLLAHRDAARVLAATAPFGPRRLRLIELSLSILRSSGLADADVARAAHHINNFVTEFVADEGRFAATANAMGASPKKLRAEARKYFSALPAAEFPVLRDLAGVLTDEEPGDLFEFGIDVWTRGLASLMSNRTTKSGRR